MLTYIGGMLGLFFCLGSLVFRWKAVVAKYGSLSLYWWVLAVTIGCAFVGYLADLAIWSLQSAA